MKINKTKLKKVGGIFILLGMLVIIAQIGPVYAASNTPTGPDRYTYTSVEYTVYQWWMMTWANNELVCEISVEHEGLPFYSEVYVNCGEGLADAWLEQENCPVEIYRDQPSQCPGFYLFVVSTETMTREIAIALPAPVVWVTLPDCTVENGTNRCESPPTLLLQGEEPLSTEEIIAITGTVGNEPFSCAKSNCELPLAETEPEGVQVAFWATSSYGDTTLLFDAHVRVLLQETEAGDFYWYVDVLSPQWRGLANASCAESWAAFPPEGGVPLWLSTPEDVSELESDLEYTYLAGNLIERGVVDASQCIDFGIDAYGQATPCGLDAAKTAMLEWQNRFDQLIMDAAQETQVPAVLLKRLFARESQFWPGVFNEGKDVGLGQLTIEGADFAFTWNSIFFEQFCPLVLDENECEKGYLHISEENRDYLRESLIYSVNATCDTCPLGIDLRQADYSINVFANTLRASCEQTSFVVYNNTGLSAGTAASYEDLWRFTLVNYNAGAGCLGLAIDATIGQSQPLIWENLSQNLTEVCADTKNYVNDIHDITPQP